MVIAVVAVIVVGPKELPKMLRTFGKTMGQVRRTANDFKRQFDEALREAERETDLGDVRKSVQSIGNPLADLRKDMAKTLGPPMTAASVMTAAPAAGAGAPQTEPPKGGAVPDPAAPSPVPAVPEQGSDAA